MQDLGILEVDLRVLELDLRFRGGLGSSPIGLENFRVGLEIERNTIPKDRLGGTRSAQMA